MLDVPNNDFIGQTAAATDRLAKLQRQFLNPETKDQRELKKAAQGFEAVFVQQLMDQMDKTIDREKSLFHGGHAEDTFRKMMNQHIAMDATSSPHGSVFGLAETIYQQMSRVGGIADQVPTGEEESFVVKEQVEGEE